MSRTYEPELKKKIMRLRLEEGRTMKSITEEYGISRWCNEFSKECQTDPQAQADYDYMKEALRLKRENDELRKEVAFLKKAHSLQRKSVRGLPVHR